MSDASTKPGSPGQLRGALVPSRDPDIKKVAAALVSAAVVICGLYYGREILIPLAIAFLITFALNPPVTWLVRRGLPRLLATSLVMVVVVGVLAGLGVNSWSTGPLDRGRAAGLSIYDTEKILRCA